MEPPELTPQHSAGQPKRVPAFPFLTGFEGTHIFGSGFDVLETTEHVTRYRTDLARLREDGVSSFRACIPWHRVERQKGAYDWAWTDSYLACAQELGLDPILDPLHHTSFPDWLTGGFADPEFGPSYVVFVEALARRYPWVESYTVINEPFVTTWFCGHCGIWHPRHTGHECFVRMLVAVARTICLATAAIERAVPSSRFVHADSCEHHSALDDQSIGKAEHGNRMRFCVLDLILGRVGTDHPLFGYLTRSGMGDGDLGWFAENPARVDVIGLDYYSHSELAWTAEGRASVHAVAGFASVGLEYAERYRRPLMLSETNLRGTIDDRIGWLRYMGAECLELADRAGDLGLPFEGFCWYPYIDSTDWSSLVCEARREIDPQGIYSLDEAFDRNASELSQIYAALAGGQMHPSEIPARGFGAAALRDRGLANYIPHMPGHSDGGHSGARSGT